MTQLQIAVPFGQVTGTGPVHRVHPVTKLVWIAAYVVLAFSTQNIALLGAMVLVALALAAYGRILGHVLRGALVLVPLGASLIFLQSVAPASAGVRTAITTLGPFTVYEEGMYAGLVLFGRIASCLLVSYVFVSTTHQSDLFAALARLKVPYTLNFMMAMTFQLIPVFQREVGIILSAQKSRGMKGTGFQAVLPSFVPVFVGAIERVQQLSVSLESRGFGSTGRRTSYRRLSVRPLDWVLGVASMLVALALAAVSVSRGGWPLVGATDLTPAVAAGIVLGAAAVFLATLGSVFVLGLRR